MMVYSKGQYDTVKVECINRNSYCIEPSKHEQTQIGHKFYVGILPFLKREHERTLP